MWTVFMLTAVLVFVNVVSVGTIGDSDLAGVSEVRVCMPVVIMSESVRSRMAARGWVTCVSLKLDELCNIRDIDNLELRDAIEELDRRLKTLDIAQSVVELELTVEQLEEDITVASEFRDKARVPRMHATKMMAARLPERAPSEQDSMSVVSAVVEAKLPKLELPTFSGDVTEWTSFWDQQNVFLQQQPCMHQWTVRVRLSVRRGGVMDTPCLGVMTSQECPLVTGNLYYVV